MKPTLRQLIAAVPKARRWMNGLLAEHAARTAPVSSFGLEVLGDYYPRALLDEAKVVAVDRVPQVPLSEWGIRGAEHFEAMEGAGITFGDTFFILRGLEADASLFFHELVHVVQWRRLGVSRFLTVYGLNLLEHGYRDQPLERIAYDLQARFDRGGPAFDVQPIVQRATQELLVNFRRQSLLHRVALMLARVV